MRQLSFCEGCGAVLTAGVAFCESCGQPVRTATVVAGPRAANPPAFVHPSPYPMPPAAAPVGYGPLPPKPARPLARPPATAQNQTLLFGVIGGALVILLIAVVFLVMRSSDKVPSQNAGPGGAQGSASIAPASISPKTATTAADQPATGGNIPTSQPKPAEPGSIDGIVPLFAGFLLQADFAGPSPALSRAWVLDNSQAKSEFAGGEFHVRLQGRASDSALFPYPGVSYTDFGYEANVRFVEGPGAWIHGLVFRHTGDDFYAFLIGYNGDYVFDKRVNGKWQRLKDWTISSAIKPRAVNKLAVICQGSELALLANGQLLANVTDDALSSGSVGLYVQGDPGIHVAFTSLNVRALR